jgi:transcriptional regulator with XRE-family HTH domain
MSKEGMGMFKNRSADGKNNLCGTAVARLRKASGLSQRILADQLQLLGLDVDKNAIQRIESGQRFVTDIELVIIAKVLNKTYYELLNTDK